MTAQIRPNRMEVSDRFPMLGFSVRVDEPNVEAEVVLANDISLFDSQNKTKRNASNFYTSRENGTLVVPRGDGVFVVAPTVLARFIGSDKLYFGLATGHSGNGGLKVDALPREGSPYVSLRSFTGRTLRRNFGNGRSVAPPKFEWTGDAPHPSSEPAGPAGNVTPAGIAPARNGTNGAGQAAPGSQPRSEYDDGFGPMPAIPARESAYRVASPRRSSPRQMGIMLSSGTTARDALNWIMRKVEQAVDVAGSDASPPSLFYLGANSSTFITAWEAAFGLTSFIAPANAFLAGLPALARETGVTLSIGPALDTPLFGGGVGVVFGPDGQVALFGAGEISADLSSLGEFASSLKLALQAKMKLGYNSGGIAGFASLGKVAAVNVGEEIVGGAELWLDRSGNGIGGAVSIGVGLALQLAAERQPATTTKMRSSRAPARMGITMSSGTTARDALNWIMRKVEQAVAVAGSDVSPPALYYLGDNSSTFITAWEAAFGLTSFIAPANAFLAGLPALARETGVTLSIGPALDTPLFGGGVGVVFGTDGQVALFGAGEISADLSSLGEFASSLKLALQAKMKLGYNSGGIAGFASLGKVAAVNVGEEIVGGAELWLDRSGNGIGGAVSIGVGLALQLAADQAALAANRRLPPAPRSVRRGAPAKGMVVGLEDRQKVRKYARDFIDIFQWSPSASVVNEVNARGFSIQKIGDAVGDLNLDFYKIDITRFPDGWDASRFLLHFIRHINDFIDTNNTEFSPYADSDAQRLASDNLLGTVFKLDFAGPDNAAVVISDVQPQYFAVTTIHTPDTGDHPVSGHRMFGYANESGKVVFFTRAADRPTLAPQGFQQIIFKGAEWLWESMQKGVAAFCNDNGGAATIVAPFSERFDPTAVREEFGHYDGAQGLALENADTAIVRPVLPNDQRGRAARIGGPFAGRVGEALDIGLDPKKLDALLDTLDPPATAQPMSAMRKGRLAKAQSATRSINWDDVELIPQPTDQTCWAAAGAMVIGWRDQVSLTPDTVAGICKRSTVEGLSPFDRATFAGQIGLNTEPPQSYSVDGFYDLLTNRGPLWVSKIAGGGSTSGHAVVVTGMYTEGDQSYVRVADPWDRIIGTPGTPGGYASTHGTGSRYIMKYEDFQTEYELRIVGDPPTPQILHSGGTDGRIPNTGTSAPPAGYAMAAPSVRKATGKAPARTRAIDPATVGTIAGIAVSVLAETSGDIAWQLPQWAGHKHPNDIAPKTPEAPYMPSAIALYGWPSAGGTYANCVIRWYYNGTSIGPVYVERSASDDTWGWGLLVTGTIQDDPRLYPRSSAAMVPGPEQIPALHVALTYEFHAPPLGDDPTASSRITLYADGTHEIDNEWLQKGGDLLEQVKQAFPPHDVPRTSVPVPV